MDEMDAFELNSQWMMYPRGVAFFESENLSFWQSFLETYDSPLKFTWVYPAGHQLFWSPADCAKNLQLPKDGWNMCTTHWFILVESAILKTKYCIINSNHPKPNQTSDICLFLFASKNTFVIHGFRCWKWIAHGCWCQQVPMGPINKKRRSKFDHFGP